MCCVIRFLLLLADVLSFGLITLMGLWPIDMAKSWTLSRLQQRRYIGPTTTARRTKMKKGREKEGERN